MLYVDYMVPNNSERYLINYYDIKNYHNWFEINFN